MGRLIKHQIFIDNMMLTKKWDGHQLIIRMPSGWRITRY